MEGESGVRTIDVWSTREEKAATQAQGYGVHDDRVYDDKVHEDRVH